MSDIENSITQPLTPVQVLVAECERTLRVAADLAQAHVSTLTTEQRTAYTAAADALDAHRDATQALYLAELQRHLPGFALAIAALWAHIRDGGYSAAGRCCTDGAS